MKRRTPAICAEERCVSPTIKRTKVQAQRKFAQGCNNYTYSSTKITSKPADACSFSSIQTTETASASKNNDCELNNFSSLPTVDDFLTFLCFRETEVLPERLNYLNTPRYNVNPTKKKPMKLVPAEEHTDRDNEEFEKTGRKSKSPLKNKNIPEYKLRSGNVKTKNIVGKPSHSLALKHNQRLRSKSVVKAKFSENKLQTLKHKNPLAKPSVPHSIKPTKFINKSLQSRSSTILCDKEEFIKPDTNDVCLKRVTRRNSVLELKPDISKNIVPYKKLVGNKSKCNTTKQVPVSFENTRCCMKKPSARSLRVSLPKFKPDVTNAIVNKSSSKRVTRSTRSSNVQKETPPVPNPNSRPMRRTKEAAALYMEMLGKDDDDSISLDSFPEIPSTEEYMHRKKEIKEVHRNNNTENALCYKSNFTNTKSFAKSSEFEPSKSTKDAQKNSIKEKLLPMEATKEEGKATMDGRHKRLKQCTVEGNVPAVHKDLSVRNIYPRTKDGSSKLGRRNLYNDIFDKAKPTKTIFSKKLDCVKVVKKVKVNDNKTNKSDDTVKFVKKSFDEKHNECKSKKNSKFKSKLNSYVEKCKRRHHGLELPLRRSNEPLAIEKPTRKIVADNMNDAKSSDSEVDDEAEPLQKILQKIKDKKAKIRELEKKESIFERFHSDSSTHPIVEKISRRNKLGFKPTKKVAVAANNNKELLLVKKDIEPLSLGEVKGKIQVECVSEEKFGNNEEKESVKLTEVKFNELNTFTKVKSNESRKVVKDQPNVKFAEISKDVLKKSEDGNPLKPMIVVEGNFKELKTPAEVIYNEKTNTVDVNSENLQKKAMMKSSALIKSTKTESKTQTNVVKVKCKENTKATGLKSKDQESTGKKPEELLYSIDNKSKEFRVNVETDDVVGKVADVKLTQINTLNVELREKIKAVGVQSKELPCTGDKLEQLISSEKKSRELPTTVETNPEIGKTVEVKSKQTDFVKVKCKEKVKNIGIKSRRLYTDDKPEELLSSVEDRSKDSAAMVETNLKQTHAITEIKSKQPTDVSVKCKEKIKVAEVKSKALSSVGHKSEEPSFTSDESVDLTMIAENNPEKIGRVGKLKCNQINAVKSKRKEIIKPAGGKSEEALYVSYKVRKLLSSAEKSKELTVIAENDPKETGMVAELKCKSMNAVNVKCKEKVKTEGIKSEEVSLTAGKPEELLSSIQDKSEELMMTAETNLEELGKVTEVKSKSSSKKMELNIQNIPNAVEVSFNHMLEVVKEKSKVAMKALKLKTEEAEKCKEFWPVEVKIQKQPNSIEDPSMKAIKLKSKGAEKSSEVKYYKEPKSVEVKIRDQINKNELKFDELTKSVKEKSNLSHVASKVKPTEVTTFIEERSSLSIPTAKVKSKDIGKCVNEKFGKPPIIVDLQHHEAAKIVEVKSKEQRKLIGMKCREPAVSVENKTEVSIKIAEMKLEGGTKTMEVKSKQLVRSTELNINESIKKTGLEAKEVINTLEINSKAPTRTIKEKSAEAVKLFDQKYKGSTNYSDENSKELKRFREEKCKELDKTDNTKPKELNKEELTKSVVVKSKVATEVVGEEMEGSMHSEESKSKPIIKTMEMKSKEILKTTTIEPKTVNSEAFKVFENKSEESTKTTDEKSEKMMKMVDTKYKTMINVEKSNKFENIALSQPDEFRMTLEVKAKESEKIKKLKSTDLIDVALIKSKEFTDLKTKESEKLLAGKSKQTKFLGMEFNEPTKIVDIKSKECKKTVEINPEDLSKLIKVNSKVPTKIFQEKSQEYTQDLELNAKESSEAVALISKMSTTSEHLHSHASSKISTAKAKNSATNPDTKSTESMKILDYEYKPSNNLKITSNKAHKIKEHKYVVKSKEATKRLSGTVEVKSAVLTPTERVQSEESSKIALADAETLASIYSAGSTKSMNILDSECCKNPQTAEMQSVKIAEVKDCTDSVIKSIEQITKTAEMKSMKSVPAVESLTASDIPLKNIKEPPSGAAYNPVSTIENPCKIVQVSPINDDGALKRNVTNRRIWNKSDRPSETENAVETKPSNSKMTKKIYPKIAFTSSQSISDVSSLKKMENNFPNVAARKECKISEGIVNEPEMHTGVLNENKVASNEECKNTANSYDTPSRKNRQETITSSKNPNFKKPQQRSFFSNSKTTKDDKTVIQTVVSSNSKAFNLESKKIIFKKNTTSMLSTEVREEPNARKSEAFSPDNENSVYAFEPDLPTTSPPFRRFKPVIPPKSIAVQVNLETDIQVECSSASDAQVSSTTDCGDRVFYIPIQTSTSTSTLGVALKLDTDGPNQKIIMSATLITNSPTLTTSTSTTVTSNCIRSDNVKLSSIKQNTTKILPSLINKEMAEKIDKSADVPVAQATCSSTSSASSSSSSPKMQKKVNSQSVKIVKLNKSRNLKAAKVESMAKVKSRPANKNVKKSTEDCEKSNSENIPSVPAGEILEAPTFYPTAEEFNDPLEYIDTIRPEAEKYGLCRIVPPSNFRPECKVADEMRFTAYNQYVHKMLHRWGPNVKEMMAIKKFLITQNITFTHPPWIGGMEVDLPRLYQIVQQCGGLKDVIEKERWHQVADIMKIPKLAQDRITKLDNIYCKYLLPYDVLSHGEREKLFEEIEKEWNAHLEDPTDDEIFDNIDECIVKGRTMPLSCFYRIARNTMLMCFGNLEGEDGPTTMKIEEEFWNHVSERKSHICVHSGSIDSGTHGYGFSVAKNSTFQKHPWNLKVLTNNSASILRSLGPVMGVTVPTLHVGMLYSACCWYRDPHCLPWIEYLHTGANKIWYGIPDEHSEKLKEAMLLLVPRYCRDKKIWLPSDTVMIPPPLLTSQNISMSRVVQHPGQFIVVFPKSFTSSISTGYLVSESVYFAHAAWLDSAKQIFMDMQDSCEPSVFSLEQLLICIAEDARASLEILTKVLPLLVDLRDTEVALRNQLKELGLNDFEKLNVNKKRKSRGAFNEEDIYECETCRTNLFVSLVISSHEQSNYCLRHAATMLYKKPALGKHYKLMYVYTEKELETLIEKVKSRIEVKSSKKSHGK